MNYLHAFHAGNFADVFKHAVLTALLLRLCEKERPVSYIETHAGAGFYRLDSAEARRSGEAAEGIGRLAGYRCRDGALEVFAELVAALPENARALAAYPGSPLVGAGLTRSQDRLQVVELYPGPAADLARLFRHDERVAVHCRDGYESLKGLLPPKPRAGMVFIDPPYEAEEDFPRVVEGLKTALTRWPEGVAVAWYPIRDRRSLAGFYRRVGNLPGGPVLRAELSVRPDDNSAGLNGSGIIVASPPWGMEERLARLVDELAGVLCEGGPHRWGVDWLRSPEGSGD